MELLKQLITRILGSGLLSTALVLVRAVTVLMVLYVIWRCYTSFKKGQRRKDPVVMLEDAATGAHFPVLYWENSIGRSRSCDIQIPDNSVSRDHAVLMRREEGWFVCDTGSHAGTRVRNKQITEPTLVQIGDKIRMGSTTLTLRNASDVPQKKRSMFTGFSKEAASPFKLMLVVTLVQMSLTLQLMIGTGEFRLYPAAPFVILFTASWVLYFFSRRILKRVSFEIETVGLLLSSIGILLLSGEGLDTVKMQIAAFGIGIVLFCFLVWFMSDLERVMKLRLYIAIGAILLFVANLVLGKDVNGSRNWIFIGPFSFQPSEFIKIAFVFVGASTLDHLQTKKNITEFIVFAAICLAFLFLMRDFGTALIFFACFLIIAFMRSGSFRTIFLILAAACFGVFLILQFKPYVAQRFSGWMHVWEHAQDSLGYPAGAHHDVYRKRRPLRSRARQRHLKICRRRRQRPRVRYAVRGAGPFNGHGSAVRARPLYPLRPQRCHTQSLHVLRHCGVRRFGHAALSGRAQCLRPHGCSAAHRASRCRSSAQAAPV